MDRRETSGAPPLIHPRWDVASPTNWSASLLLQTTEDRGMKLPSGIKNPNCCGFSSTTSTLDPTLTDVTPGATTRRITSLLRRPVRCRHLLHRQLVQLPLWLHRGRPLAGASQLTAIDWLPWRDNIVFRLRRLRQHMPGTGDHQPNVSYSTLAPRWSHLSMSYERYKHRCRRSLRDWITWTNDRSPRDNKPTHPRSSQLLQRSTRSSKSHRTTPHRTRSLRAFIRNVATRV